MNFVNYGGGEIWSGIESLLLYLGHATVSYSKKVYDVRNSISVDSAFNPDWIIYTAGVSHIQSIIGCDLDKIREEFLVNAIGLCNVLQTTSCKNVIAITSVAGLYGKPNHAGYSASKMALRSIIQSLSREHYNAYGIAPGRVDTLMREHDYPGEDKRTRLSIQQVAMVVKEILDGKYKSGDNIVIRKRGYRVLRRVDNGEPWKTYLKVGYL